MDAALNSQEGTEHDPYVDRFSIFNLSTLDILGESMSDAWSNLLTVNSGRGFFQVGGGILLMDISDPTAIAPQAFFPIRSWTPNLTIEGDSIFAAAGRYGVYTLSMDTFNLLPVP